MRTIPIVLAIWGGFLVTTWYYDRLPIWLAALVLVLLLTWYGSLQHETIHGHPTSSRRLNLLIACWPLALWIPYPIYRQSHLLHHRFGGRILTDPALDPESFYLPPGAFGALDPVRRFVARANNTLLGRLILGPPLLVGRFYASEVRRLIDGDRQHLTIWLWHILGVGLTLAWVVWICDIPITVYVGLVVYLSTSLTLVRSFIEHRADSDVNLRTAVVEAHPFWGLLFLHNNLHLPHHAQPQMPWYELPEEWRRMQNSELAQDAAAAGLVFHGGYAEVFRRFLVHPAITVEYPSDGSRWR